MNQQNPYSPVAPAAPIERLIRLPEVLVLTGMSRTQVYEKISAGELPAPIKDGRSSRWVLSEVQTYIARKVATLPRKA